MDEEENAEKENSVELEEISDSSSPSKGGDRKRCVSSGASVEMTDCVI